jgi:hypothetical protein
MSEERANGEGVPIAPARVVTPIPRAASDYALKRVVPSAEASDYIKDSAGTNPDIRDFVKPSELREFVYCQRSWFLARQGHQVSAEAQRAMDEGVAFHQIRAAAAEKANDPRSLRWAGTFAILAILLLLLTKLFGH